MLVSKVTILSDLSLVPGLILEVPSKGGGNGSEHIRLERLQENE